MNENEHELAQGICWKHFYSKASLGTCKVCGVLFDVGLARRLLQIRLGKENETSVTPTFIVKPDGGSQGDGIYLIRDPSDLKLVVGSQAKQAVVQEYIPKPLLIDKLKFDIRLYVLIRSLEPLEIYIAKEGLTRFCTEPYQVVFVGICS